MLTVTAVIALGVFFWARHQETSQTVELANGRTTTLTTPSKTTPLKWFALGAFVLSIVASLT